MKYQFKGTQFTRKRLIDEETHPLPSAQNPIAEQDTATLPAIKKFPNNSIMEQSTAILQVQQSEQSASSRFSPKILSRLPGRLQRLLVALLVRASDPQAEVYSEHLPKESGVWSTAWGWSPLVILTNAIGIALVAYAFANSLNSGEMRAFLYPGLLLIFAPTAIRLISPNVSSAERISLICTVGISCYLIKVISSPLYFSFYNEFLHWATVDNIVTSGHLFSQNTLLPVSPYYPGLEIVTSALSSLGGLNTFYSGLIVIGVARLLMILILFILNDKLLNSARMASIATILYMANPHFLLYDSQFGYESLALPLALFVITTFVSSRLSQTQSFSPFLKSAQATLQGLPSDPRWITVIGWITLVALTLTHHMTDFFLDGVLLLWAVLDLFLRRTPIYRSSIFRIALLGIALSLVWINFKGNPVVHYIAGPLVDSLQEFGGMLTNLGNSRSLFTTYGGSQPSLWWERLMIILSILLIILCLPFGLLCIRKRYRSRPLIYTLGFISLFYPLSQIFRFTNFGANLTDRAAAFLFVPIALVLAIFIAQFWPAQRMNWKRYSLITSAMSILFLGGFILGAGSGLASLPGQYEFGDPRGIGPEGIQAAIWAPSHIGSNKRIGTDLLNQVLMGTYGDEHVVTTSEDHVDVSPVFFSSSLNSEQRWILKKARVQYLVVDLRLAHSLPTTGFYFVQTEPGAYQHTSPIPLNSLTKFDTVPQIAKVFDSGNIVIYDTEGFINA